MNNTTCLPSSRSTLTSNQRFGALNRRFDRRARLLRRLGWTYREVFTGIGAFVRRSIHKCSDVAIAASFVMVADNDLWIEELAHQLRRSR